MPFRAPGGLIIYLEPFYIDVPKKTMRSTFLYAKYQTGISAASAVNDAGYALWQVYPSHANANLRTAPAKPTRPYRRRPVPVYLAVGSSQTFATPLWCTYQVFGQSRYGSHHGVQIVWSSSSTGYTFHAEQLLEDFFNVELLADRKTQNRLF